MSAFLYHVPEPPTRAFSKGDKVIVVDSQGMELSTITVKRATTKTVTTDCGRTWGQDGRWHGEGGRAWPFPTIKHANTSSPPP